MTEIFRFDFELPPERIAQEPPDRRDVSRLMVLRGERGDFLHARFDDLPDLLEPGDLLVLNDTRVVPARLAARRRSGARLDVILVREAAPGTWIAMIKGAKRVKAEETILVGKKEHPARLRRTGAAVEAFEVDFGGTPVDALMEQEGRAPLPPYIRRDIIQDERDGLDRERYQTVYARHPGAVAAPTAGMHFTPALFDALAARGVERATVTLHVGPGTFLPVKSEHIEDHRMHAEYLEVGDGAVEAVRRAKDRGARVIPVGSTSLRALETAAGDDGRLRAACCFTDLFIRPGYAFRVADGLVTNFHLPRSTLVVLVAAMAGLDRIQRAYAEAIRKEYRFYSYGDAMLIL